MAKQKKDNGENMEETEKTETPETTESVPAEEEPRDETAEALAAEKEKFLRLAAEYDNFRKRSIKEKETIFSDVRSDTVSKLLPVYDNLERALSTGSTDEAFYKGVEMTMTQMREIFQSLGVTEIKAVGEPFDPTVHNAVMHVEDPELGENVVAEEFQKGFMLGDRVIRCSVVKVAN